MMPDGRTILFYTWPDEPDVPMASERPSADNETAAAEPWSVETQPDV